MNRCQKSLNKAVNKNIKLYPEFKHSFYKRGKVLKEALKLYNMGAFELSDLE